MIDWRRVLVGVGVAAPAVLLAVVVVVFLAGCTPTMQGAFAPCWYGGSVCEGATGRAFVVRAGVRGVEVLTVVPRPSGGVVPAEPVPYVVIW